jgi:rhamnogalacturonan acetylesterase
MKRTIFCCFLLFSFLCFAFYSKKPTLYIIGDSTVKNGDGSGKNGQMGWGSVIDAFFDTCKLTIQNHAIGGRSTRTFISNGRWEKILTTLHKGDYVIMQFGHNDASPLDDTARARGTLKGIGNDSVEIYNPIRKQKEIVYSYGWYLRRFVSDTKARGATAIICSPIPRNNFKNGKIERTEYAVWAKQIAEETGACFIPLQEMIATQYEKMDTAQVNAFFPADHTHTNKAGALLNAQKVIEGIKTLKNLPLNKFVAGN